MDVAIQEMSAQFEKLLQTNKTPGSDSGKTAMIQQPVQNLRKSVISLTKLFSVCS